MQEFSLTQKKEDIISQLRSWGFNTDKIESTPLAASAVEQYINGVITRSQLVVMLNKINKMESMTLK